MKAKEELALLPNLYLCPTEGSWMKMKSRNENLREKPRAEEGETFLHGSGVSCKGEVKFFFPFCLTCSNQKSLSWLVFYYKFRYFNNQSLPNSATSVNRFWTIQFLQEEDPSKDPLEQWMVYISVKDEVVKIFCDMGTRTAEGKVENTEDLDSRAWLQ